MLLIGYLKRKLKLLLLDPLSCSGACMLSHSTADLVEVFASVAIVAIAALLPQQLCLLLLVTFLEKRSSVPLRIAIISA